MVGYIKIKESNQFAHSSISRWEVYLQEIYLSSINVFHNDLILST